MDEARRRAVRAMAIGALAGMAAMQQGLGLEEQKRAQLEAEDRARGLTLRKDEKGRRPQSPKV